jgi:hypothetical protein
MELRVLTKEWPYLDLELLLLIHISKSFHNLGPNT